METHLIDTHLLIPKVTVKYKGHISKKMAFLGHMYFTNTSCLSYILFILRLLRLVYPKRKLFFPLLPCLKLLSETVQKLSKCPYT